MLTSIDLFSGPGGLALGFQWAGIKPLIAVEWDYWTAETYAVSHDAEILELDEYLDDASTLDKFLAPSERPILIRGDINRVEVELLKALLLARYDLDTVDVVTGGAPCESFSMAGERREVDDRNQLYRNIVRIARGVNSRMFMFENVKGLFSKRLAGKAGAMYRAVCDDFEYVFKKQDVPSYRLASRDRNDVLLCAADYGVPQMRERLFLVGLNNDDGTLEFHYPAPTHGDDTGRHHVSVGEAIMDLPRVAMGKEDERYTFDVDGLTSSDDGVRREFLSIVHGDTRTGQHIEYAASTVTLQKAPGHTEKMLKRMRNIQQGESMKTAYERLVDAGRDDIVGECFPRKIYGARNRRLKINEPSFTVTSHCLDEMIHPTEDRGLTPREAARLQSFPDWYQFRGPLVKFHSDPEQDVYEQIGDAVPPLLAYALGKQIAATLGEDNSDVLKAFD